MTKEVIKEVNTVTGEIVETGKKVTPLIKAQRALGKVTFTVSKHAPLILTGVGILGLGATAYYAYKSRDKVNAIVTAVEDIQDKKNELHDLRTADNTYEGGEERLAELEAQEANGELEISKPGYILDLLGATALPITLGIVSGTAIGGSWLIQNRRIAGLAGALATTTAEHQILRKRMETKYGKEELERLETEETEEIAYTDAKGREKTKKQVVRAQTPANSMGGRWFADSSEYFADDHAYNLEFLRSAQRKLDTKIFQRGYLRFNEVMDALGLDRIKSGEEFGWNTGTGFELNFQTTNFETTEDLIPQIFIRWTRPISIYHDVDYNGGQYSAE